jgi:hypothetical protein
MTAFINNGNVLSAEKASEIMNRMIDAGTFSPDNYTAACGAFLAVTTPPAPVAVEPVRKPRKQRAPNAPGSQQGWAAGVTREEYSNWLATLTADYTGKRNSYAYRDIRDNVTSNGIISAAGDDNTMADSGDDNSNDATFPPAPPSTEEIHGVNQQQSIEVDDLEAIVKAEEEKHTALAGNVKPGIGKKKKA